MFFFWVEDVSVQYCYTLKPCFSLHSAHGTKKATELAKENQSVHGKSNVKLNTSICLSFMTITCKQSTANLNLIDQLIDSPDTSTVHGELC